MEYPIKNQTLCFIMIFSVVLLIASCTRVETPVPMPPSLAASTPLPTNQSTATLMITSQPVNNSAEQKENFPRIANLWGLYDEESSVSTYGNFDLLIPYTFDNPVTNSKLIQKKNPLAIILHTQFATKGRPDSDEQINQWWNSTPQNPGYACLFRNSKGKILLSPGWNQPEVNLINPYCREIMVKKNITEFNQANAGGDGTPVYSGIYWDLLFGHISWLSNDIDSNLDGKPDDPAALDQEYLQAVSTFLQEIRTALPNTVLIGNEADPAYQKWINGRLFEWQLASYLDGLDLQTYDEIIQAYRGWSAAGVSPKTTIFENAPEDALFTKYGFNHLNDIPDALMQEASESYQRMRFGLTSALLGDGYFSFDLGKMDHGQFWWYDEYGRVDSGEFKNASTLPAPGYLGLPLGDPFIIQSSAPSPSTESGSPVSKAILAEIKPAPTESVWARLFEAGIVLVNPSAETRTIQLPQTYCKLKGNQAPLYQTRQDDDQAQTAGTWQNEKADWNQFGDTVHITSGDSAATITYTPDLLETGKYEVFAWVEPLPDQAADVQVKIFNDGGTSQVTLNESSGVVGWHSLGTYNFTHGQTSKVILYAGSNGKTVADAFKWVSTARYNDGSKVNEVSLNSNDGIVLTKCPSGS